MNLTTVSTSPTLPSRLHVDRGKTQAPAFFRSNNRNHPQSHRNTTGTSQSGPGTATSQDGQVIAVEPVNYNALSLEDGTAVSDGTNDSGDDGDHVDDNDLTPPASFAQPSLQGSLTSRERDFAEDSEDTPDESNDGGDTDLTSDTAASSVLSLEPAHDYSDKIDVATEGYTTPKTPAAKTISEQLAELSLKQHDLPRPMPPLPPILLPPPPGLEPEAGKDKSDNVEQLLLQARAQRALRKADEAAVGEDPMLAKARRALWADADDDATTGGQPDSADSHPTVIDVSEEGDNDDENDDGEGESYSGSDSDNGSDDSFTPRRAPLHAVLKPTAPCLRAGARRPSSHERVKAPKLSLSLPDAASSSNASSPTSERCRVRISPDPPQISRTHSATRYPRQGIPPVEKLSMREWIELQGVREAVGVWSGRVGASAAPGCGWSDDEGEESMTACHGVSAISTVSSHHRDASGDSSDATSGSMSNPTTPTTPTMPCAIAGIRTVGGGGPGTVRRVGAMCAGGMAAGGGVDSGSLSLSAE